MRKCRCTILGTIGIGPAPTGFQAAGGRRSPAGVRAQSGIGLTDGFIKNTYEVLSPLNRLTALMPMTDHRFLTANRKAECTRFGKDVDITVNYDTRTWS